MNVMYGIVLIAIGAFSTGSFAASFRKIRVWSWESYWMIFSLGAYIIMPLLATSTLILRLIDNRSDVLKMITTCNIRNYSIFHKGHQLFAYFEYVGENFDADMAKMAADPTTQKWRAIMMPMQQPIENREEGDWWANMEEVFHLD